MGLFDFLFGSDESSFDVEDFRSMSEDRRHNRHNPSLRAMSSYQSHLRDDDGLHEYCGNLRCQTIHWLSSHRSQKENQIVP